MKTWRPDTCGCHVEEIYNLDGSIQGGGKVLARCKDHATIPDVQLYDVVLAENRRKNNCHRLLVGLDGVNFNLSKLVDGSQVFKDGVDMNWTYSGAGKDRVLTISLTGVTLTTQQRNAALNFLNNKFGVGKVVIL